LIEFSVFLYSSTDKLVITDIDGTISKSDLKGHLLPRIGLAGLAHHAGVVQLLHRSVRFVNIGFKMTLISVAERGYTVVYLTARSIAHDRLTRDFLFNDLQKVTLFPIAAHHPPSRWARAGRCHLARCSSVPTPSFPA
jgi:phosphatidate phosphatase LPIN